MDQKQCSGCGEVKSLSDFHKKEKSVDSRCKDCKKQYQRTHYEKNKPRYLKKMRDRAKSLKVLVDEFKADKPCADCKEVYPPYVMDFDHLDATNKRFCISLIVSQGRTLNILNEEMAKCELVCSNCHRIRTHNRKQKASTRKAA